MFISIFLEDTVNASQMFMTHMYKLLLDDTAPSVHQFLLILMYIALYI